MELTTGWVGQEAVHEILFVPAQGQLECPDANKSYTRVCPAVLASRFSNPHSREYLPTEACLEKVGVFFCLPATDWVCDLVWQVPA